MSRLKTIPVGESTGEIKKLYGAIQEKTISNFFSHVHDTKLDFPEAKEL